MYKEGQGHERKRVSTASEVISDVPDGSVRQSAMGMWKLFADRLRNLMAKDEFKNLGFGDEKEKAAADAKKAEDEKGVKGELRW